MLSSSSVSSCYSVYKNWLGKSKVLEAGSSSGIYSEAVVVWLMIFQRLKCGASLLEACDALSSGAFVDIAGDCKRTRNGEISNHTGGYSLARTGLAVDTAREVSDELFEWLSVEEEQESDENERPLYAVDGATVELSRTKELVRKYPPCERGYYPMLRMVVCHDLRSGLAVRPEYGAFSGKRQKSEVQLVRDMFSRLPENGVFIGDRAYGIFSVVHCAQSLNRDVIFRLTNDRAKKILGKEPRHGIDTPVIWKASHHDRAKNPEFSKNTEVQGRVICLNVTPNTGGKSVPLYVFTTLMKESAESIIEMYGLRWNIEVDIRSLKKTASMELLNVKTVAMAEKELLLGIAAYNLVIAVRRAAARKLGLTPRALSYKRILGLMELYAPLIESASEQNKESIIERFWNATKAAKHPKRRKIRTEPRAIVRHKRPSFPTLSGTRAQARKKTQQKN